MTEYDVMIIDLEFFNGLIVLAGMISGTVSIAPFAGWPVQNNQIRSPR